MKPYHCVGARVAISADCQLNLGRSKTGEQAQELVSGENVESAADTLGDAERVGGAMEQTERREK